MTPATDRLTFTRREEDLASAEEAAAIAALLQEAFPGFFKGRTYFKQLPCFRILATEGGDPVGQVGVIHRMIRAGETPRRIFGVVDLCVCRSRRGRGIGGALLNAVAAAATAARADYILLFADRRQLYEAHRFRLASNRCTYLAIDEHRSLGLVTESLGDCMMVRELGDTPWPDGAPVDLLGHVF